jgi:hypothetical protein
VRVCRVELCLVIPRRVTRVVRVVGHAHRVLVQQQQRGGGAVGLRGPTEPLAC